MNLFYKTNITYIKTILYTFVPLSLLFSPALNSILIGLLIILSIYDFSLSGCLGKVKKLPKTIVVLYISFLLLHLISLLYTSDFQEAFSLLRVRAPLFILPFILFFSYDQLDLSLFKKVFLVGVLLVSLFTLINSFYSLYLNELSIFTIFKHYVRYFYVSFMPYEMHPTYFGLFLNTAFIFALDFILNEKKKYIFIFSCVVFTITIYLISSQMTFFVFICIIGLFIYKVILMNSSTLFGKKLIVCLSIIFLVLTYITVRDLTLRGAPQINNTGNLVYRVSHFFEKGDITRRKNWESAYNVIRLNAFYGVGIGDSVLEMQKFRNKNTWVYRSKLNAHNQYLEELVHFGLFGLSLLLFMVLLMFFSRKKFLAFGLVLIIFCSMFSESILNRQIGVTLFIFLLFYAIAIIQEDVIISQR